MRAFVPALVVAALLAAPSAAQAQAAAPALPSVSHLAAAGELVDLMQIEDAAMVAVLVSLDQQIKATPALGDFREVMEAWARDLFTSEGARLAFARLYAEEMSEADIRQLVAFYQTPVGRRLAGKQAALAARGAEVGQRLAEERQADLMQRVQKRQQELQKP